MGNLEHALSAYENALRHNSHSLSGLTQVAGIARIKENYPKVRLHPNLNPHYPPCLPCYVITTRSPIYLLTQLRVHRLSSTSRPPCSCKVITAKFGARSVRPTLVSSRARVLIRHFPGHCYPMQDDLQKAYAAYQQALYFLPQPKVRVPFRRLLRHGAHSPSLMTRRTRSCGTASGSCTTAMAPWITPRKPSRLS